MIIWGGLSCCFGAIALYIVSQQTGSDVEFLESATKIHKLKDLESKVFPLIVAISGIVGSQTNLIKCAHSDIFGVLVEETVEQQFLKRNWKFSWVQDSVLMEPICKEVPWYLEDGTGRVNVTGAYDAAGLVLKFGSEAFEKAEPSSRVRGFFDSLRGLEMIGVRRVDGVLQVGTQLNIVGEVVKDGNGNVRIQKPEQGFFYISHIPVDQFIYESGKSSRWLKYAGIVLTILGVILISKDKTTRFLEGRRRQQRERQWELERQQRLEQEWQQQRERERQREHQRQQEREWQQERERQREHQRQQERERLLQNRLAVVVGASKKTEQVTRGLEKQHENRSDETDLCVICLEKKYNAVYVPCHHMCCCITCSLRVKTCPLCRRPINQVLQIYRH